MPEIVAIVSALLALAGWIGVAVLQRGLRASRAETARLRETLSGRL
jgi:hypothetical protein